MRRHAPGEQREPNTSRREGGADTVVADPVVFVDRTEGGRRLEHRRLRPGLLVETFERARRESGWYAVVAHGGRRELWAGHLNPDEACLAVLDLQRRAVIWFCRADERSDDSTIADRCVAGAGGLWDPDRDRDTAWSAVRTGHAATLLVRESGITLELLDELLDSHPDAVDLAVETWLAGHERAAVGVLHAPIVVASALAADETSRGAGDA